MNVLTANACDLEDCLILTAKGEDREVWLPVPNYEGYYEASNLGRIRRAPECGWSGILTAVPDWKGYLRVTLSASGVAKNFSVHRIILTTFCGPPPFDGAQTAHNDGNPLNCKLTNLRWATPKENQADTIRHGRRARGIDVYGARLNEDAVREIRSRIGQGERNPPIASDFGVSISTIHLIRHNRIWRHVT